MLRHSYFLARCYITIEEVSRREIINLVVQMKNDNISSLAEKHGSGDTPVSIALDGERIILVSQ
jgi:hypothetical protein